MSHLYTDLLADAVRERARRLDETLFWIFEYTRRKQPLTRREREKLDVHLANYHHRLCHLVEGQLEALAEGLTGPLYEPFPPYER